MDLDGAYFLLKAGIADRVDHDAHNNKRKSSQTEKTFWKVLGETKIHGYFDEQMVLW